MLKTTELDTWSVTNSWYVENPGCVADAASYIFALPGDGITTPLAMTESFKFESLAASPSLFKNLECRSASKPLIEVGAEALTNSWKYVKFESINTATGSSLSQQYSPLVSLGVKKPLTAPVALTPIVTLDYFEVLTFNSYMAPSYLQSGRVIDLKYAADPDEILTDPTVDQVFIKNSKFEAVKAGGDGAFA